MHVRESLVSFAQIVFAERLLKQAFVDLAERDRQRLLLALVLDERTDVLQQTLIELREVANAYLESACSMRSSIGGSARPVGIGSVPNAI